MKAMEGGAGCGGCWGIWVLSVVGLGVEEVELHFLPLEIDTEREREREIGFTFMKLGEVDTLMVVDVYKLQPQRKGKDLLVEGQSVKED